VFISRSSLWTDFDCFRRDKALAYLERSKPLPIKLSLLTAAAPSYYHSFFVVIPHAIGRLRSLSIQALQGDLQDFTAPLSSHPAPLLEKLSIRGDPDDQSLHIPMLTSTLSNGDLSSLRKLCLECVPTELPWRNMVNLTSFVLVYTLPGEVFVKHLLDFFASTPHLRNVDLDFPNPTPDTQNDWLVLLTRLEKMKIIGRDSAPLLLNHLLIPVGACLIIEVDLLSPPGVSITSGTFSTSLQSTYSTPGNQRCNSVGRMGKSR
jgi:hypothetical protein